MERLKILVLCPTRGRPANAERLTEHFYATCGPDTDLVFLIDENDPRFVDYLVAGQKPLFYYYAGEPKKLGPWLNVAAKMFSSQYDIVGFVGDDVIPRTDKWDNEIRKAFEPNAFIYPNDGLQGAALPTSVFMDARMIEKAGYMVFPRLTHLYIDNHWKKWGEYMGTLKYLEDVHLEHMHPFAGKAESDAIYEAVNHPTMYVQDKAAYDYFTQFELGPLSQRILNG